MSDASSLLCGVLIEPASITTLELAQWDLLLRQAQKSGLAARLHALLTGDALRAHIPERALLHLQAAATVARRQHEMVRWEVAQIEHALYEYGIPVVLLKGAAYVMAELPCARGRMFSDVDLLVPHPALKATELALFGYGWVSQGLDAYDTRYYRQWMHELPPLTHLTRKTVLDVHHTILPPTARLKPDPRKLLHDALPLDGYEDMYVPCPADMVLHSATHLFHEGEFGHGLRDLVDLDDLTRHFAAQDDDFWSALLARARQMDLCGPLYYGLRYAQRFLHTPVPAEVSDALRAAGPGRVMLPLMDALFDRGLAPHHRSCDDLASPAARWLLYVRSHYLRMPMRLLLPHLARKAWMRRFASEKE